MIIHESGSPHPAGRFSFQAMQTITESASESRKVSYPLTRLETRCRILPADTVTPVSLYLKLRDRYPGTLLLECTDYHSRENSYSLIGLEPIASFKVQSGLLEVRLPDGEVKEAAGWDRTLAEQLQTFTESLQATVDPNLESKTASVASSFSGFFGHTAFEAVEHFDNHQLNPEKQTGEVPALHYRFFRFIIAVDHFHDRLYLIENAPLGGDDSESRMDDVVTAIRRPVQPDFPFRLSGPESSTMTDEGYLALVEKARAHCQRGDVFQLVLSRRFSTPFRGDEFSVYRELRSVNPSPYLFFFDFGEYKVFGSSPEAQLVIRDQTARIDPIAGTVPRTGRDEEDSQEARRLAADPKENAEHVMLVDLARNDLGRHGNDVEVVAFREVRYFSHVIHLVSEVEAQLPEGTNPYTVFGDTFPAGTLSGAPKHKAVELIDRYEPHARGFYGGAIGFFSLSGSVNHAIAIRTFLSKDSALHYQAGAGLVIASDAQSELEEVNNKLGALRRAMQAAHDQNTSQS